MKRLTIWLVVGSAIVVTILVFMIARVVDVAERLSSPETHAGIVAPMAMARVKGLVELHGLRYDRYPESLQDLRFLSEFDRGSITWVDYGANEDGTAYCLALREDVAGVDSVTFPAGYWEGTGFDSTLTCEATAPTRDDDDTEGHGQERSSASGFSDIYLANLNMVVGQLELYKLRFGVYPAELDDLPFVSPLDPSIAMAVYTPSSGSSTYKVTIRRGPFGQAEFNLPEEYWQGTGCRGR